MTTPAYEVQLDDVTKVPSDLLLSAHKCIYYGRFAQLARQLEELLRGLEASGEI